MKDPIVDEVRRAREAISERCGFDMHKIALIQKQAAAGWKGRKVSYEDLMSVREASSVVAESHEEYGKSDAAKTSRRK